MSEEPSAAARRYDEHRERAAGRQAAQSRKGRDIGELPPVADPARRAAAAASLERFCRLYFPGTFTLPWSRDHPKVIAKIEDVIEHGGTFAGAMPRGSGKTSLCEKACLWALLTGRRRYVFLVGAEAKHATDLLDSIKIELETNDVLGADWPEACHPFVKLEGIAQKARGQLYRGQRTHVRWEETDVRFAHLPGAACSGAIIQVAGILGKIRGAFVTGRDGKRLRPDLCIVDDPQTAQSARSGTQCDVRLRIVTNDVLGMAGPGKSIAAVMPVTVIRPGDVADQVLDRDKHPEWRGERCKLVYAWPTSAELWDRYAELRREGMRTDAGPGEADAFYLANRAAMDAGADLAWPERFAPEEHSAVQHAMNLRIDKGADYVDAEMQNEPRDLTGGDEDNLVAAEVLAKACGVPRGTAPAEAQTLTAFVDVQKRALFWVVCAWDRHFGGHVVDYGTWPRQRLRSFTLADLPDSLQAKYPGRGLEGQVYAGLQDLAGELLAREWPRQDGTVLRVERCLVDASWGEMTDTVYLACRQLPQAAQLLPSHGRFIGPDSAPISRYKAKPGELIGQEWVLAPDANRRAIRHVTFDANWWKTFVAARLRTAPGDRGCLGLFGQPAEHHLLAAHCVAEYRVRTEGHGRVVQVWRHRPERQDNHWWDGLVGCAVGASAGGLVFTAAPLAAAKPAKPRRRVSYLEA